MLETLADFLATTGETESFERFVSTFTRIRREFPELEPWLRREIRSLRDIADDGITEGLLAVCRYLADHPRCGLFSRELPVAVDTKFVERHATKILRPWLDLILSPSEIRADEKHFERRIGLGYAEPLIRIRFLDPDLQQSLGFQFSELALPLAEASRAFELGGVKPKPRIYVVENLVNALTLPAIEGALVLVGLGYSVNLFRNLSWLHECPEIRYWGDIDAQGFEILSQFRSWFPQTRSLMMDRQAFDEFSEFRVTGQPSRSNPPSNLTAAEAELNEICRRDNIRLEQEKIRQAWVVEHIQSAGS